MEEELTASEREQMRLFAALQKVASGILLKWMPILIAFFIGLSVVFSVFLVWHYAYSGHRFDAVTRLMYTPRKSAKVEPISDRQLMSILERSSLKRRIAERMTLAPGEAECLKMDMEIVQERKPSNIFTLKANAPTWVGAVRKVNKYAEILVEEYITYRRQELENLRESLLVRKKSVQDHIAENESEDSIAKASSGVASPVETLTMINALLSDQRRNLSMMSVDIANEEVKKSRYESQIGKAGPIVVANAAAIRKQCEALEAIDNELAKLREIYTDINPKVLGKLEDRKRLLEGYSTFLKEKGIEGVPLEDIDKMEKVAGELAVTSAKLEVLSESQRSLKQEIEDNERKASELIAIIPNLERLRIKREDLGKTLRDIEDQIDHIDFLQMAVESDLQQIERAGGAGDKDPLSPKNFALGVIAAFACTLVVSFWILAVEFIFGKVRGAKEVGAYGDVEVLGSLPKPGSVPEDEEKDIYGVVALNYCNAELPKGVVVVCRLPGVQPQPKFKESLDWSLTMSGQNCFHINIVPSVGFEPPEGAEPLINTFRKADTGWFPVANRYSLAPTELQMLQADIMTLRNDFDVVFLFMPGGLRRGGSFFSQLLGVSESVLLEVGANLTPRSELEYVRRHVKVSGKPMMAVVTDATARVVRSEMEAKK